MRSTIVAAVVMLLTVSAAKAGDARSTDAKTAALQGELTGKWVAAAQAFARSEEATAVMNQAHAALLRKRKELTDAKAVVPPPGASTKARNERIAALETEVRFHEKEVTQKTLEATEAEKEERRSFAAVRQMLRDHPTLKVPDQLKLPDQPTPPDQGKCKVVNLQFQVEQLAVAGDEKRLLSRMRTLAQLQREVEARFDDYNRRGTDDEAERRSLETAKQEVNTDIHSYNEELKGLKARKQKLEAKLKAGRVPVPRTLEEVDLEGRIAAVGMSPPEAGEFFGWETARVTKAPASFTREQLLGQGWTKERLLDVAEGYEHVARITPQNPSAAERATQLREIAKLFK